MVAEMLQKSKKKKNSVLYVCYMKFYFYCIFDIYVICFFMYLSHIHIYIMFFIFVAYSYFHIILF